MRYRLTCLVRSEPNDGPIDLTISEETEDRIEEVVERLLEPFDEKIDVTPYMEGCWECYDTGFHNRLPTNNRPNPSCLQCQGKGTQTTYNLKSRWDYWQYDICCVDPVDHARLVDNIATVESLLSNPDWPSGYAVLTPEGVWHDRGNWTRSDREDMSLPNWLREQREIFAKYGDCYAISVSCHI